MKIPSIICFILWFIQSLSCQEIRMDQSPPQVKKPGESVKISCKISGYDMTSYLMHWIRQKPGKALEWIGFVNSGTTDEPTYADSMKDRFTLTEDVSTTFRLHCGSFRFIMKIPSIICFILWSIQSLSCQEIRMDQSPPQVKKPGESVKIS
ncbi:hypothetical protein SRHO_G00190810 [Serrasalmus rhombeus]